MFKLSADIFRDIINLFLPPFCISCNNRLPEKRYIVCSSCYGRLEVIKAQEKAAFLKRIENKHFDELYIKFHFSKLFQQLMYYFKYEGFIQVADYFAKSIFEEVHKGFDVITYVPLHQSKMRERGFNQSAILAGKVCELLELESIQVLERIRYTESQTKLSRHQRKENMNSAFQVTCNVKDKSLLIIDDVITTGATLNECARALKNSGAKEVSVFAVATPVDILQEKLETGGLR